MQRFLRVVEDVMPTGTPLDTVRIAWYDILTELERSAPITNPSHCTGSGMILRA